MIVKNLTVETLGERLENLSFAFFIFLYGLILPYAPVLLLL